MAAGPPRNDGVGRPHTSGTGCPMAAGPPRNDEERNQKEPPKNRRLFRKIVRSNLNNSYILGLEAFLALGHREFNTLALFQIAEALARDRAEVYEHIFAAIAGDESETLSAIEPFYGSLFSFCHGNWNSFPCANSTFRSFAGLDISDPGFQLEKPTPRIRTTLRFQGKSYHYLIKNTINNSSE